MRYFFEKRMKRAVAVLAIAGGLVACGQTVTQEVYPVKEIAETEVSSDESTEDVISKGFVPREVKDISEIKKIRSWLEYFYYNNIFDENINNETGEITEDAMISFAASYIMQLEHKGLRFDADTFRLYIPKKTLEEVVMRFFGYTVTEHHSISKHGILYEEENYVIQASAREWPTRLDIILVMENAPKVYSAILNGNNTEIGEVDHQIKAEFEWKEDRYRLKKYQMITDKAAFVSGNPLDVGTAGDEPGIESSGSFGNSESGSDEEKNVENSGDVENNNDPNKENKEGNN